MAKINKEQIATMEEELMKLQKIELSITGDNTKTGKLVERYGAMASVYEDPEKLDKMIDALTGIITDIARQGRVRGKVMSLKTIQRFLDKEDRVIHTQRTLDAIDRANTKKAEARIGLYVSEMLREHGLAKTDIDILKTRAAIAGFSTKETLKNLVRDANSGIGPVPALEKRLQSVETAVLRREASATEIDEYRKVASPDEEWEWITISTNPCPDCEIRAGTIMSFDQWNDIGLPGDGRTICRSYCMCKLMPVTVAEEMFPEAKTFEWDKESGVLTTRGEMQTIKRGQE